MVSSLAMERIIRTERPILHEVLCLPFPYKRHVVDKGNDPTLLRATYLLVEKELFRLFLSQGAH